MNPTFIALLRGINVGGHHKVPMPELRKEMESLGFEDVTTLLNSGNVIFKTPPGRVETLEEDIESHLEGVFGFAIPVMTRNAEEILELIDADPFGAIEVTDDTRLYVSFLKEKPDKIPDLPWVSDDESWQIIDIRDSLICSVLDLSVSGTTKGMGALEKLFGKNSTTRNWNTLIRIAAKV